MAWDSNSIVEAKNTPEKVVPSMCIGVPYKNKFTINFLSGLFKLELPEIHDYIFDGGSRPLDLSRNIIVSQALQNKFEYILFLDSDIVLPDSMIANKLMKKKEKIVSAVYMSRANPQIVIGAAKGYKMLTSEDLKGDKVIDMEHVGMGCCLIHASVFHEIGKNRKWRCLTNHKKEGIQGALTFDYEQALANNFTCPTCKQILVATFFRYTHGFESGDRNDEDGKPIEVCSEDYYFCELAKKIGITPKLAPEIEVWHETSDWLVSKDGMFTMSQGGGLV